MEGPQEYEDANELLRHWHNSDKMKARILTACKSETISKALVGIPTETKVAVFRTFVARFM